MSKNDLQTNTAKPICPFRAALYLRLSKEDGDNMESDSITAQREILENFVRSQPDIELSEMYIDDGCTGTNFDRPGFQRMIRDIDSGKINCVIVKDNSRLGRNYSETGRYIENYFPKMRTRFISLNTGIDTVKLINPAQLLLLNGLPNMMNEMYVAQTSNSIRTTLNVRRQNGLFIGSFASYGYQKDPDDYHKLIVDDKAALVVKRIFHLYLSGTPIRMIVRTLNEEGIVNPSTYKKQQGLHYQPKAAHQSSLWSDRTVRRILQNEMYIGNMVQGKNEKFSYKDQTIREKPKNEWIVVKDTHEAIIDKDDFDRAQKLLKRNIRSPRASEETDLFAGLLVCGDCHHAMCKKVNQNTNKTYTYYKCSTHKNRSKTACSPHTVRFDKLYNAVLMSITHMISLCAHTEEVLKNANRIMKNESASATKDILNSYLKEKEKYTGMLKDLYPDYKSGFLSREQYLLNKQDFEAKLQAVNASIEKLSASLSDENSGKNENAFLNDFIKYGNIQQLTRPILLELIDKIVVYEGGRIAIHFRFADCFIKAAEAVEENKESAA